MNKTDKQMVTAVLAKKPGSFGNTTVSKGHSSNGSDFMEVRLFGHKIAVVWDDAIEFTACGWQTKTTKRRLNAILSLVTVPTSLQGPCKTKRFTPEIPEWELSVGNQKEKIDVRYGYIVSRQFGRHIG